MGNKQSNQSSYIYNEPKYDRPPRQSSVPSEQTEQMIRKHDDNAPLNEDVEVLPSNLTNTVITEYEDGYVWTWGNNAYGQLGRDIKTEKIRYNAIKVGKYLLPQHPNNCTTIPLPVLIGPQIKISQVVCGMYHTVALATTGDAYSWGRNIEHQLGRKTSQMLDETPKLIEGLPTIIQVACGSYHTAFLTESSVVLECGRAPKWDADVSDQPTKIVGLDKIEVTQISCGGQATLALSIEGNVYEWGSNLGRGSPVEVVFFKGKNVSKLDSGLWECVALTETGDIYTWPNSEYTVKKTSPKLLEFNNVHASIYKLVGGKAFNAAITDSAEVYTWQRDPLIENSDKEEIPTLLSMEDSVREIASGDSHGVLVCSAWEGGRRVYSFGKNNSAQLGYGKAHIEVIKPLPISFLDNIPFKQVSCGGFHSALLSGQWIGSHTGLADDLRASLNGRLLTDFVFIVNERSIPAHKAMLYCRCPQFYRDNQLEDKKEMTLTGFNEEDFSSFLSGYLYTDKMNVTAQTAPELLKLATLFEAKRLKAICEIKISQSVEKVPPSTLIENMKNLFNNQILSDITFIVEGRQVYAHKFILASRCEYYRALFLENWSESRSPTFEVEDMSYDVFTTVLHFIYTDEVKLAEEIAVDLFSAANQLQLLRMKMVTERYIASGVDDDNVCGLLNIADMMNAPSLKRSCFSHLGKYKKILLRSSFKDLPPKLQKEVEIFVSKQHF